MDKIIIANCGDIPFDTRLAGALYVENGVVKFDKVKTFNAQRRLMNAGLNTTYVNRFALTTWTPPAVVDFDWESPAYFTLLREYVETIHNPTQSKTSLPGADIVIDLFLGCVETWQYYDWSKSINLINAFFTALGDLPYVHFAIGRECNSMDSVAWVRDCVAPTFKAVGRIPFSYGASYCQPGGGGPMEMQKGAAVEKVWDERTALKLYRPIHNVKDETSFRLLDAMDNWTRTLHDICVIISIDGIKDGESPDDFIILADGRIERRPSVEQIKRALRYFLNNSPWKFMPDGQVKYGFETMTKAMTVETAVKQLQAVAEVYLEIFGVVPENYGKYVSDWVEPLPPVPEPEPIPTPLPKPVMPPFNWTGWWNNNKWYVIGTTILVVLLIILL